jgi:hypothetical protein
MTMPALEVWLEEATRRLSKDSAEQVGAEIQEHYECAREAAVSGGASVEEAERSALAALGDAKTSNLQYRRVLVTASEERMLREGNWEGKLVCSHPWIKRLLWAISAAALLASAASYYNGLHGLARGTLALGIGTGLSFTVPFLPIYTPSRSRVARVFLWAVKVGVWLVAFGPGTIRMDWLMLVLCLWHLASMEWTRASLRRKLPVAKWPKQLYL